MNTFWVVANWLMLLQFLGTGARWVLGKVDLSSKPVSLTPLSPSAVLAVELDHDRQYLEQFSRSVPLLNNIKYAEGEGEIIQSDTGNYILMNKDGATVFGPYGGNCLGKL